MLCSNDKGKSWYCLGLGEFIEFDGIVCLLVVDFLCLLWVYVGVDCGVCLSDDVGVYWWWVCGVVEGMIVWLIVVDFSNFLVIYVGMGVLLCVVLFKLIDVGEMFVCIVEEFLEFCVGVNCLCLFMICVDFDDGK